jgi:hypothetical protein
MTISSNDLRAKATRIQVMDDRLVVDLDDGRSITVPIAWCPRPQHANPAERANARLIGGGEGFHWPDLDEDLSVEGLLAGRRSGESLASLNRWFSSRKQS